MKTKDFAPPLFIAIVVTLAGCSSSTDPPVAKQGPSIDVLGLEAAELGEIARFKAVLTGADTASVEWRVAGVLRQSGGLAYEHVFLSAGVWEVEARLEGTTLRDTLSVTVTTPDLPSEPPIKVQDEPKQPNGPDEPRALIVEVGENQTVGTPLRLTVYGPPGPVSVKIDDVAYSTTISEAGELTLDGPILGWTGWVSHHVEASTPGQSVFEDFDLEVWGQPLIFGEPRDESVRPGMLSEICTTNFIFHHKWYRFFIGSAAHCVGDGGITDTGTNGCEIPSLPIGHVEDLEGGFQATLTYSSWLTMQEVGETSTDICYGNDFALFELSPDAVSDMHPATLGLGSVKGLLHRTLEPALVWGGAAAGEPVVAFGRSDLRDCVRLCETPYHDEFLSSKQGQYLYTTNSGYTHRVYLVTPGIPGDSGGPLLTPDGYAIGHASTMALAPYAASNGYADTRMALQYMQDHVGWAPVLLTG